jgi:hypothetical protein
VRESRGGADEFEADEFEADEFEADEPEADELGFAILRGIVEPGVTSVW